MAVDAGRAHWQRRAKRAAASAAAPCPASAERALLPLLGKFKSKQASKLAIQHQPKKNIPASKDWTESRR
jgi:hypothetical protein